MQYQSPRLRLKNSSVDVGIVVAMVKGRRKTEAATPFSSSAAQTATPAAEMQKSGRERRGSVGHSQDNVVGALS
ncbi:unnamed protein product [Sphagnum jensenii]|uniref:Uncharacterized protein n=1 Tax=Sphagnum jensenii TaxID=128206 RepID=A0ABP1APW9_9BRYO